MDLPVKIREFHKRWSVIDSSDYQQEFRKFKTRVLNIFSNIDSHVTDEGIADFCQVLGIPEKWEHQSYGYEKKFYEMRSAKEAIKSAESLRRTLEEFLRFKLKNQCGLTENIRELQTRLKSDNRDSAIRNIVRQTFNCLDLYFNENSKHKDGDIDEPENEYLIYQTGALLRYINRAFR